jgi:hypothetical protein
MHHPKRQMVGTSTLATGRPRRAPSQPAERLSHPVGAHAIRDRARTATRTGKLRAIRTYERPREVQPRGSAGALSFSEVPGASHRRLSGSHQDPLMLVMPMSAQWSTQPDRAPRGGGL